MAEVSLWVTNLIFLLLSVSKCSSQRHEDDHKDSFFRMSSGLKTIKN